MTQQSGGDASGLDDFTQEDLEDLEICEKRRSSMSLAIPVGANQLNASVEIKDDQVSFEAHGVEINRDGLFIEGKNVSEIHQDDLRILGELGRGACSVVKRAQHVETRLLYAVKVFSAFDRNKRAQLLKEVETLWGMECPSLISFVGGYLKDGSIHIILEYMDGGSLTDLIHKWRAVDYGEEIMSAVMFQMLWGLGYLHYEHHMHRDVKPQNVLLNSNGEVKLSDFGIARELDGEMDLAQTMVGTIRYMSPERLAGAGYGVTADVWSLGLVLLEMAARSLPFDSTVSQIELHDILEEDLVVDKLISMAPGHSAQFEEVLRGCLQPRPEQRLRPEELLELDWFQRFRRRAGEEQDQEQEQEQEQGQDQDQEQDQEQGQEQDQQQDQEQDQERAQEQDQEQGQEQDQEQGQEKEEEDDSAVSVIVEEGEGEGVQQTDAVASGDAVIILPAQGEAAGGGEAGGGGGGGGGEVPRDGMHEAWKGFDAESGQGGDEGGETCETADEDDDVGGDASDQHDRSDLDRATQVVHDFIQKAVEAGALVLPETGRSKKPSGRSSNDHGLTDSSRNGMIYTMCSDGSVSDLDADTDVGGNGRDFDTDFDVDFLAFPDFENKAQAEQNRPDAALL